MVVAGSSPRVWGTVWDGGEVARYHRFIPTCVGNCMPDTREGRKGSVHPHVCGELLRNSNR